MICFVFVLVHFWIDKNLISVCFGVSDVYRNNWNKQICFKITEQTKNVYGKNQKKQFCLQMNQKKPRMYIKTNEKNCFVSKWTEKNENVLNTKICVDLNLWAIDSKFSQIVDTYRPTSCKNSRLITLQMRPGGPSKTGKLLRNKKIRENISVSEGPLGLIC